MNKKILIPLLLSTFMLSGCAIEFSPDSHTPGLSNDPYFDIYDRMFSGDTFDTTSAHETISFKSNSINTYDEISKQDVTSYLKEESYTAFTISEAKHIYKTMGGLACGDMNRPIGIDSENNHLSIDEANNYIKINFDALTFTKVVIKAIPRYDILFDGSESGRFSHQNNVAINANGSKFIALDDQITIDNYENKFTACKFKFETSQSELLIRVYGQQACISSIELYA